MPRPYGRGRGNVFAEGTSLNRERCWYNKPKTKNEEPKVRARARGCEQEGEREREREGKRKQASFLSQEQVRFFDFAFKFDSRGKL